MCICVDGIYDMCDGCMCAYVVCVPVWYIDGIFACVMCVCVDGICMVNAFCCIDGIFACVVCVDTIYACVCKQHVYMYCV